MRVCVSIHVSVSIIFLHCCIVCITSPTSKWTVPARTYLKINAVLDVAKKLISFTGVSLSSAHTPKHTQARSDSISVTTHRQNAMLVADLRFEQRRWLNSSAAAGWKPAHGPTCFFIFHRSSSVSPLTVEFLNYVSAPRDLQREGRTEGNTYTLSACVPAWL